MRYYKNAFISFFALSFALLSVISFADQVQPVKQPVDYGDRKFLIKLLSESTAALQKIHPDIAADLDQYAGQLKVLADGKPEPVESEKALIQRMETRIKILSSAAAALKLSHPDLAADLTKFADKKAKKLAEKKAGK